jgi:hypothetical protein
LKNICLLNDFIFRKLNYWFTPQANMLNGTGKINFKIDIFSIEMDLDGSLFPPNLSKNKQVYSYNADMCR